MLQDVFVRAYGALRNDNREMNVRAWLYRVAHNRCIDHLRRPVPPAAEIFEVSRKPLHDPVEEAQRRDDLRQLVADVGHLPEQQRSALLMREIDGMTYADLADALDVTVPAVKSLLVRARVGLVEAAEARDADCAEIHADLLRAYDRGVKASGRARKHMRSCDGCTEYRTALRGMRRSFAALTPLGAGPLAFAAKLIGLGGSGAAAAAAGGGGGAVARRRRRRRDRDRLQGRRGRLHGGDRHRRRGRGQPQDLQHRRPRTAKAAKTAKTPRAARGRGRRRVRRRARRPPAGPDARARPRGRRAGAGQARAQGRRRRASARARRPPAAAPVAAPSADAPTATRDRPRPAGRDRRRPRPGRAGRADAGRDRDARARRPIADQPQPTPAARDDRLRAAVDAGDAGRRPRPRRRPPPPRHAPPAG